MSSPCVQGWELNVGPEQECVSMDGCLGLALSKQLFCSSPCHF